MADNFKYATLMASLPYLHRPSVSQPPPLSRIRLDNRLKMLSERDAATLQAIEDVLRWSNQSMDRTDADIVAAAERLLGQLNSSVLQEAVMSRMEFRTILAALRRRHRGESAPPAGQPWGYGRWVASIARNWTHPAFQLDAQFPWIVEAKRLMDASDFLPLEKLLVDIVWTDLERIGQGHQFDFEAVVLYVLRWDLVARWTTYSGEAATERFAELVDSGLEELDKVFA
ncbi:DUF2764 family protein [Synechococcus sp. PCC 7336]|uniref:DUF2764 family protein n=1 Tax=Synechococcus sp. PCC 7336 TaxID=195250 RepID=UPI0003456086|nr:DUF2764 family protein [Synechococcus sp. PCC 7336]